MFQQVPIANMINFNITLADLVAAFFIEEVAIVALISIPIEAAVFRRRLGTASRAVVGKSFVCNLTTFLIEAPIIIHERPTFLAFRGTTPPHAQPSDLLFMIHQALDGRDSVLSLGALAVWLGVLWLIAVVVEGLVLQFLIGDRSEPKSLSTMWLRIQRGMLASLAANSVSWGSALLIFFVFLIGSK